MKKKTLIIIGILVAVIVLVIIIFVNRDSEDLDTETSDEQNTASDNLIAAAISEGGYPIHIGVSKRKEVANLQAKLKKDYGANLGTWGVDGKWGDTTEREVLKYLKKNRFNTYGELLAAYGANPPASNSTSGNATNIINIVSSFFNR